MNKADGQDKHHGHDAGPITEYFCTNCLQLRLSVIRNKTQCGNCGSMKIIGAGVGQLDKQALLKQYTPKED